MKFQETYEKMKKDIKKEKEKTGECLQEQRRSSKRSATEKWDQAANHRTGRQIQKK